MQGPTAKSHANLSKFSRSVQFTDKHFLSPKVKSSIKVLFCAILKSEEVQFTLTMSASIKPGPKGHREEIWAGADSFFMDDAVH